MRIHNKIGSTNRLVEVFEKVNKLNLNEWYDDEYHEKPSQSKGIGDFNNVEWEELYKGLINNQHNLNEPSKLWTVNDLTDYDGMLSPEELEGLVHFNVIEIIDNSTPILGNYKGYNEFYNKAKESWGKDWDVEGRDPEEKIFSAMQGGVGESDVNERIVQRNDREGKYYQNPQYNNGQREVIELPVEIGKDLLRHPNYEFSLEMTGGSDKRVQLFFNGVHGDFLLIVEADGRTYLAHLNENDYLEIKKRYSNNNESVNELDIPQSSIQQGVEFPIQMMDDSSFPHDQSLPSPQEADASIRVNPSKWKALFTQQWGEEGSLVFDGTWWNVVGNDKYTAWKEGGIANKASWLDNERGQDRHTMMDGHDPMIKEYEADDFTEDVKLFIYTLEQQNVDYQNASPMEMWEAFEEQFNEGSTYGEFDRIWKELTNIENQTNMFEDSTTPQIKYNYDQNGNWIPEGYESLNIGLRPLEQPLGSGNWKQAVVRIENDGNIDVLIVKDSWDEAKSAIFDYIK